MSIGSEVFQERDQEFFVETVVRPRQDVLQVLVVGFDGPHRIVDGLADVGAFRQLKQIREPGALGQVENTASLIVSFANRAASASLACELCLSCCKLVVGVSEEDQAEDGNGVFRRFQFGVGPEFVGGSPQALF